VVRRRRALLGLAATAAALTACSAIIGTRDLVLVADDAVADDAASGSDTASGRDVGAASDTGTPDSDARVDGGLDATAHDASSPDGAVTDARADAADASPTCTANTTSDPAHCGRCGHSCLGGLCTASVCQPVAIVQGQDNPYAIAVDATRVYWTTYGGWTVMAANKDGSSATVLATDAVGNVSSPVGIAVDDAYVYWVNHDLPATPPAPSIARCAKTGCALKGTVIASNFQYGEEVEVDTTSAFWTEAFGHDVGRVGKAGATPGAIVTGLDPAPNSLALDDTFVFFGTDSTIARIAKGAPLTTDGGAYQVLFTGSGLNATGLVADDANVYWAVVADPGLVEYVPKAGPGAGGTPRVIAAQQRSPYDVAVDATNVYWTSFGPDSNPGTFKYLESTVSTCPKTGCPAAGPTVLAKHQHQAHHLAVDDVAVYWTDKGTNGNATEGAVMRVAK
jgi:hypothetical protein